MLSRGRVRITCVDAVPRQTAERWLEERDAWFEEGPVRPRRAARARIAHGNVEAVAKREDMSGARAALRTLVGTPARARRAFETGLELERRGVRAARPLALLEERRGRLARRTCLVLEYVEGLDLREFILRSVETLGPGASRERLKRRLWSAVAAEVARMHEAGARQRDLKAPNIIVSDRHGGLRATLIDLDGMMLLGGDPSRRLRARDLGRLAASLRAMDVARAGVTVEDWRFLLARYLEACRVTGPGDVDRLFDETQRWAALKEARNRRRGRVLR